MTCTGVPVLFTSSGPSPLPPPSLSGRQGSGDNARQKPYRSLNSAVLVRAQHGAVASENKVGSDLGVDVLRKGGNAVSAGAVNTLYIGVVNMFSCVAFSHLVYAVY